MYFGHIGFALAAKPVSPKVNLGVTLAAATALDTISGVFSAIGIEYAKADGSSYFPWSHGLFMSAVWPIIFFAIAFAVTRKARTGFVLGALVFSHWMLDFISHPMGMGKTLPPDLPLLFEGSAKVGLGLYNSAVLAFAIRIRTARLRYLLLSESDARRGQRGEVDIRIAASSRSYGRIACDVTAAGAVVHYDVRRYTGYSYRIMDRPPPLPGFRNSGTTGRSFGQLPIGIYVLRVSAGCICLTHQFLRKYLNCDANIFFP